MLAYDAHPPAVSEVTIGSMIERDGTASRALFSFQTKLAGLHRSTKAESWIKDVFDVPALEDCRGESTNWSVGKYLTVVTICSLSTGL